MLLLLSFLSLTLSLKSLSYNHFTLNKKVKLLSSININNYDDYLKNMNQLLNDNDMGDDRLTQTYIPAMGKESYIYTAGNIRSLLPTEYDLIFTAFEGIRNEAIINKWPDRDIDEIDRKYIKKSIETYLPATITDKDIVNEMEKYRKTILGLEKYRINNPGALAEKYCKMIKTCLMASSFTYHPQYSPANVPDGWGAAANALEYAGLIIRDHVYVNGDELNGIAISPNTPVLYLDSLWKQVQVRLLDLDFSNINTNSNEDNDSSKSKTWDQKFFSQVEMNAEGALIIKDMMLCIMRIAILAVLSSYNSVRVIKSFDDKSNSIEIKGFSLIPSFSSIRNTLDLSFNIVSNSNDNPDTNDSYDSDSENFLVDIKVSPLTPPSQS